jgi:hypothetical protein
VSPTVLQPGTKETSIIKNELLMRLAAANDLDVVMVLLRDCIADMRRNGIDQWDDIYPSHKTLLTDIQSGTMHLGFHNRETLVGALVLNEFQNAEWLKADWTIIRVPILVVHRLMVEPKHQGRGIAVRGRMGARERIRGHSTRRVLGQSSGVAPLSRIGLPRRWRC